MITPGSANALLLSQSGYSVPYSLRLRIENNAYLQRTPSSATNRKTWTYSAWIKRAKLGNATGQTFFIGYGGASNTLTTYCAWTTGEQLSVSGYATVWRTTTAVFRDPSAWYHVVIAWDTTQASASNRVRIYVNGVEQTSFATNNDPGLNADGGVNNNVVHGIGRSDLTTENCGVYLSEVNFVDGQQLSPSSFGQTDSATGVWVPKKYSGTYGTNGFYLKFADATSTTTIGNDSSGNANNWTSSGISVTSGTTFDQMLDTPTLNYCVLNPVDKNANLALSGANLTAIPSSTADYWLGRATMAFPSTGKWYWELTLNNTPYLYQAGIYSGNRPNSGDISATGNEYQVAWGTAFTYIRFQSNNAAFASWGTNASPTNGDVLMFAVDAGNSTMWVGRNGTWYNTSGTANPATNTDPRFSSIPSGMFPGVNLPNPASGGVTMNFGQRAFAYTPPTGFKALNTANLPTPSIKKGSLYMDATLRTGTGATASVSSLGFQPNFVWIKSRSNGTAHNLFNSVIGATKGIQTTGPNAQYTDVNSLTSFNSNGYSLGSDASSRGVNINTNTYVDWAWKESTTAGLDILSWTGDGTGARTINHALGVTPEFMMLRGTDARAWACWFNSMTSAAYYMDLGTSNGQLLDTTMFDSTAPTSTTFRVGSYNNVNAITYVGYFFSSISGFSQIGSYTGNASTDGPFVWCGFSPKFVMVKAVDIATTWIMANPSNSANAVIRFVYADYVNAETSNTYGLDLLSNGFKVRAPSGYSLNNSGNKYAFIAFAENPFKYSRAR